MKGEKKIILIGFMGAGKTRLGKKISEEWDLPFFDLDRLIEEEEGKSIPELFSQKGEKAFRKMERKSLEKFFKNQQGDWILSSGGGTPCFGDNMDLMNQSGTTVYLCPTLTEIVKRLKKKKNQRPLIADVPDEELEGFIQKLLDKRENYYDKAHISIYSDDISPEDLKDFL